MGINNNDDEKMNYSSEKKNFTEILSDKAEKAGESAGEAVKRFTEILTKGDSVEVSNGNNTTQAQKVK